ncbi:tRNA (adenosine(37)-N6)-threonylcarbamoyltransferase complex ATPase subunit type 1 TsaE [Facilibium subflavum]|uniref:tRNA (adenosine(37)-N6)-threonylcarbamoyltransferase complex ATPase subunit type 1 TsaE n=1 Tax=Facilibium subflavum TaxID=2219058 RepID=UPI001F023C80|nr:tRNA (adenosine(37)-N6)-threonylcarbamoyltransferase complex ATPase subunit type 1 TsaE [Facilibium subflavum]
MKNKTYYANDDQKMIHLGEQLASQLHPGDIVYLQGDLGAGKTTLVKGILSGLGHKASVKSPTYTLVESYELPDLQVYHFDLYRLSDPEELEWIGIRDYFDQKNAIALIEWPDKGKGFLPKPTKEIYLDYQQPGRKIKFCIL